MKKTLILNGSPRRAGDTVSLIKKLLEDLEGEVKVINAYEDNIQACIDCRFCYKNKGCCIEDNMQQVYDYIQECDNILIASPLYFSELTGRLLDVGSRLQTYFCARYYRKEQPIKKEKRGAVILVGGGDGNVDKAYDTACTLLKQMHTTSILPVVSSHETDFHPAIDDDVALAGIKTIAEYFNNEE